MYAKRFLARRGCLYYYGCRILPVWMGMGEYGNQTQVLICPSTHQPLPAMSAKCLRARLISPRVWAPAPGLLLTPGSYALNVLSFSDISPRLARPIIPDGMMSKQSADPETFANAGFLRRDVGGFMAVGNRSAVPRSLRRHTHGGRHDALHHSPARRRQSFRRAPRFRHQPKIARRNRAFAWRTATWNRLSWRISGNITGTWIGFRPPRARSK